MARLQVLELPMEHVGEAASTPFALIIDKATEDEAARLGNALNLESFTTRCGARAVLITPDTLDLD